MELLPGNWHRIFAPDTPLLELVARGSALYLALLAFVRLMPRRTGGELATMDLIFVLLIADGAARALGDYNSVADAIVVVATFMGWNYLVNALSYRVPFIERLVSSPPLQIIRDGELLRRNLRREFITEEELMSHLRQQGIGELEEVESAYVEGEGKITVTPKKTRE
jgi:uncharacterized membrane protein YcaP (DUF421 family)